MEKVHVSQEVALTDLFTLSTKKTVCDQCISGLEVGSAADRQNAADCHNFQLLKSLSFHDFDSHDVKDLSFSDDSIKDPEYTITNDEEVSSEESESSDVQEESYEGEKIFNPLLSPDITSDVFDFIEEEEFDFNIKFNPFVSTSENNADIEHFSPNANSTMRFNPFTETEGLSNRTFSECTSSIIKSKSPSINCEFCPKVFTNKHNMKQHLIRFIS